MTKAPAVKMELLQEAVMSAEEDTHLFQASPRLSYCPPRSYSRSTAVKRETPPPTSTLPATSLPQVRISLVKSEKDLPLRSPCAISCVQPSSQQLNVPSLAIKSEPLSQQHLSQLQLNAVASQLAIKSEHTTTLNRATAPSPSPATEYPVKNEDDLSHSTTTSPGLTTDLENFQDLSEWCRRRPTKVTTPVDAMEALPETDELNTPLIEQGEEFLFTSPTILNGHNNNITQDDDDCYGLLSGVQPSDFTVDFYACADIQSAVTTETATHDSNNVMFEQCDSTGTMQDNLFQGTTTEYQQYFINDIGGGDTTKPDHVLNYTASTIMDNSFNIFTTTIPATISDGSTKCADVLYNNNNHHHHHQSTTAEVSQCSSQHQQQQQSTTKHEDTAFSERKQELSYQLLTQDLEPALQAGKKSLRLDFSNLWMENKMAEQQPTIDTPEVINTALAMENNAEFNLVKFINDSMVSEALMPRAPCPEDDVDDQSQSASTSNDPTYSSTEVSDDEDYEPPWTKRAKLSSRSARKPAKTKTITSASKTTTTTNNSTVDLSSLLKRDVYDSELSNVSTAESVKVVRRGRPPKRNVSISSESTNADTEVSRYRELRDKNNEASRRSRLNRKMKEQHLEQEASDLETRNRKLKVRVAELDKLVNTMRTNLMQMLLKK